MRFPLSDQDRNEIQRFQLRSSCQHCFFYSQEEKRCAHEWPSEEQRQWPLAGEDGSEKASEISLCKEFELL
jgi:hypothetical protein